MDKRSLVKKNWTWHPHKYFFNEIFLRFLYCRKHSDLYKTLWC